MHTLICQLYKGLRDKSKRIIACVSWNGTARSFVPVGDDWNRRMSMFVLILNYMRLTESLVDCSIRICILLKENWQVIAASHIKVSTDQII